MQTGKMLKNPKKRSAYMAILKNEKGFTFISMLLMLTILAMSLPLLAYVTKSANYSTKYDEMAINQFFQFLRDDFIQATDYQVSETALILVIDDTTTVTIEKYQDLIRRQVNRKGHETYLRDVKDLSFSSHDYGIRAAVTSLQGEHYEKTIVFYN